MPKLRLAILGSTRGSSMKAIIDAIKLKQLDAHIGLVISNKAEALILERAQAQQLKAILIEEKREQDFEKKLSTLLQDHDIDLLILIGYMRILSPTFVQQWANQVINVHPSLLPHFAGLKDLAVHQAVINSGHPITGCSVHWVTQEVDNGPLLIQRYCPVEKDDTSERLKARVQALEGKALIDAIVYFKSQLHREMA
jgi:phosphoribosylglycinamide formyltransferase-1